MNIITSLMNTIRGIANPEQGKPLPKDAEERRATILQSAVACMMEGLPEEFHKGWIEYSRDGKNADGTNSVKVSYKFLPNKTSEPQSFNPANQMYPIQAVETLEEFLPESQKGWVSCKIEFTPDKIQIRYNP